MRGYIKYKQRPWRCVLPASVGDPAKIKERDRLKKFASKMQAQLAASMAREEDQAKAAETAALHQCIVILDGRLGTCSLKPRIVSSFLVRLLHGSS